MDSRLTTGTRRTLGLLLALMLIACNGTSSTKNSTPPPVTQSPPVTQGPPPPVSASARAAGQNAAPQITGSPPTTAVAGQPYTFQPRPPMPTTTR